VSQALLEVGNPLLEESNLMLEVFNWVEDAGWISNRLVMARRFTGCPAGIYAAADLTDVVIQDSLPIKY
jgi:hypothetical protein